jgi:ABC-type multidrug transport system fused ATPase/permease subunit
VALPRLLAPALIALLAGALLIVLLYQFPATHTINIGSYDTAYVQGFFDAQAITSSGGGRYYLDGSDGSARWSRATSALLFPQAGLPATATLRLRGWRASEPYPRVQLLLNGQTLLADMQTDGTWQEVTVPLEGGWLKASNVFIEIQSSTAALPNDAREVGVLLDRVTFRVFRGDNGLIIPYPSQVAYGALVALLLWVSFRYAAGHTPPRRAAGWTLASLLVVGAAFLLLYRLQLPFYPYPLHWLLPGIILLLLAFLAWRFAPLALERYPALPAVLAPLAVVAWLAAVLNAAQAHVTLSLPGVEKDFRVFATRTESLDAVFRADGFYNLGYPLLLRLALPLTEGNAFLAARLVAALSGALLLLAGFWLAHSLLAGTPAYRKTGALLAVLLLALNPLVTRYALYVGSDMPFAALVALALALLAAATLASTARPPLWLLVLAGGVAGAAFLVRHLGLVLLVWGILHALLAWRWRGALLFAAGFVLAASPQLVVNTLDTGQPLYNEQAKNVWLAVYANTDWGRWNEVPNNISLVELILRDPVRMLANWWGNIIDFTGSGAESIDTDRRAIQLLLLHWPANWLAVAGLLGWLWTGRKLWQQWKNTRLLDAPLMLRLSLLLLLALYVLLASTAFVLPRFFVPLVPIYAAAAAWIIGRLTLLGSPAARPAEAAPQYARRWTVAALLLLVLLSGGVAGGAGYVLAQQPADEVAVVQLVQETLQPNEKLLARLPADVPVGKYSAIAHRVVLWPDGAADAATVLAQARADGAAYLLWDDAQGAPPLPDPPAARVGGAGPYSLYRIETNQR